MRIITGKARGTRLETLEGEATRPTTERVKEALFSVIQFDIEGRRILDLFAGSGQLGIEALSRGATGCVFVDQNKESTEVIRRNLKAAGLTANTQVLSTDALSYLVRPQDHFDIVFLDPPYFAGLMESVLEKVEPLVNQGGMVICETDRKADLPSSVGRLSLARTYQYGKTQVWLYRVVQADSEV